MLQIVAELAPIAVQPAAALRRRRRRVCSCGGAGDIDASLNTRQQQQRKGKPKEKLQVGKQRAALCHACCYAVAADFAQQLPPDQV